MDEKNIIMNVRRLFQVVRSDKKKGFFKSNNQISEFLGREPSRISRYVSETDKSKMTKVTPESFTDTTDKSSERLYKREKLTRGFRLYMFIVWASKVTEMPNADDFLRALEAWAGMTHEGALKIWISNDRKSTMNRDAIKQWADVRWSYTHKPRVRQRQYGDQEDLFEFAEKNHTKQADIQKLVNDKKATNRKKPKAIEKEVAQEAPETNHTVDILLGRIEKLEKTVTKLRHDMDNPKPGG
jgi:hypothetical protein